MKAIFGIIALGVILRIFAVIIFSQYGYLTADFYRYIWEGVVLQAGGNPLTESPQDFRHSELALSHLASYSGVEHKALPSIYSPLSLMVFSLLPKNVIALQLFMGSLELMTFCFVAYWAKQKGIGLKKVLPFFLLPVPIIELWGNAHVEGLLIPFLVLGAYFYDQKNISWLSAAFLTLGVLVKLVALPALAYLCFRESKKSLNHALALAGVSALVIFLGYLPFIDFSEPLRIFKGLFAYASHWEFNGPLYLLWKLLTPEATFFKSLYKGLAASALIILFFGLLRRNFSLHRGIFYLYFSLLVLAPSVYPWYALWFIPFLPLLPKDRLLPAATVFSILVLISYEVLLHPTDWALPLWVLLLEWGTVFALIGHSLRKKNNPVS